MATHASKPVLARYIRGAAMTEYLVLVAIVLAFILVIFWNMLSPALASILNRAGLAVPQRPRVAAVPPAEAGARPDYHDAPVSGSMLTSGGVTDTEGAYSSSSGGRGSSGTAGGF